MATAAGWYVDPFDSTRWRYWDGATWTAMVSPAAPTTAPPPPPPPPPGLAAVQRAAFQSIRGLSTALMILLIVLAVTYALLAGFFGGRIALIGRILNGERVTFDDAQSADDAVSGGAVLVLLVAVAVLVLFIVWLWRAYSNVAAFGVGPRRYGRGWAIGSWFIPFANLVIPKQLVNDSWRAADPAAPGDRAWTKLPSRGLFTAWWLTFIVSTIGARAARTQIGDQSLEDIRRLDWIGVASCLLAIASCVLGIITVRTITKRQHERIRG